MWPPITAMMPWPLAKRLGKLGYRVRRSTWNVLPNIVTILSSSGNTSGVTLSPGQKKLAYLDYDGLLAALRKAAGLRTRLPLATLGVVAGNGCWCAPGADGLVWRPMREVRRAWEI